MIGHVGSKVSALIDGQLSVSESDRLWSHVHTCGACRDMVEREGWVKTRLAGLALCGTQPTAPNYLRSVLCEPAGLGTAVERPAPEQERRRAMLVAAVGAGSVGAALCGVLALTVPAQAPSVDRRGPVTSLTNPSSPARTATSRAPAPVVTSSAVASGVGLTAGTARLSVPSAK